MSEFSHTRYPDDPQDMRDELADRSDAISNSRDAAWESGYESYGQQGAVRAELAAMWTHQTLVQDFCDGWDTAAGDAAIAKADVRT